MSVLRKLLLVLGMGSVFLLEAAGIVRAAPLAGLSPAASSLQAIERPVVEGLAPVPTYYRRYYNRPYRRYYHHGYHRSHYYYRPYRKVYRSSRYYAPRYYRPSYHYRPNRCRCR